MAGFANIEEFPLQREDAKAVTTDNRETSHCQSLGRVSFRENESAGRAKTGTGIVCITELGHTIEADGKGQFKVVYARSKDYGPRAFRAVRLLDLLVSFVLGPVQDAVYDARLADYRKTSVQVQVTLCRHTSLDKVLCKSGLAPKLASR